MTRLEELGIKDNPYDLLVYYASEFFRTYLFVSVRLRSQYYLNDVEHANIYTEKINEQLEIINKLTDEEAQKLRNLAVYANNEKFSSLNEYLLKLQHNLPTAYSYSEPVHSFEFEEFVHGSEYVGKLRKLQALVSKLAFKYNLSPTGVKDLLYKVLDIMDSDDDEFRVVEIKSTWSANTNSFVNDFLSIHTDLSEFDIQYMIEYINTKLS